MKSAVQTISQESSRPDSDLAIVSPDNIVVELPQPTQPPIGVHNGQTVQWRWFNNFRVSFTSGVFESKSVNAVKQFDGWYLTEPPSRVIGPPNNRSTCTYIPLDAIAADPPPPNVIIVDNSSPWPDEK
jgi:hypothetical protein